MISDTKRGSLTRGRGRRCVQRATSRFAFAKAETRPAEFPNPDRGTRHKGHTRCLESPPKALWPGETRPHARPYKRRR